MATVAKQRTEECTLEVLAWVFGDQGGRTEYRFRVDSPKALSEKFDRIESAMRAPARLNGHGVGKDRGLSSRELWEWADRLDAEEKAQLESEHDKG